MTFREAVARRVLVFDGAMGTQIQRHQLKAAEYGGKEGANDLLVLTRPDIVEEIHARYLAVGCDVVETNTFGSSRLKLDEYGLGHRTYEVNFKAAITARRAAERFSTPDRPRFVAGSIGPTGMLPSSSDPALGNITADALERIFREQAKGLVEGGVDAIIIETQQDMLELRAAVLAADACRAVYGAIATFVDLTPLRRAEEHARRLDRLAALGRFTSSVAHEIRNPLAGIGTSAQVLLKRFEPRDDRARFVQVILDEVARLDRIVTSLLQYARPRTPELRAATLHECVDRVVALAADAIQQSRVTVEVEVAPRLPAIYIDSDLVTQVLLNVTLNAVQAMPGGGTLRYEVRRVRRRRPPRGPGRRAEDQPRARAGASGWIAYEQVRVIDTGVGIPRGVLAKMFDPFFTTKATGTGLGLSISQTIMQEHGGSIAVDSREGRGTTVLINFPLEKRHGERRQPDARAVRSDAAHRR